MPTEALVQKESVQKQASTLIPPPALGIEYQISFTRQSHVVGLGLQKKNHDPHNKFKWVHLFQVIVNPQRQSIEVELSLQKSLRDSARKKQDRIKDKIVAL